MIELNLIQEQYARMDDEELMRFAINESGNLTIDSFHLLKAEFEKRKLDLDVFESAEIDGALSELSKQTTLENITGFEFTNAIWNNALDEKAEGKTNEYIYNSLIQRGVSGEYAYILIQSLDLKAKEKMEDLKDGITAYWISLLIALMGVFASLCDVFSSIYILYGSIVAVFCGVKLNSCYNAKERYNKVRVNMAKEKPFTTLFQ